MTYSSPTIFKNVIYSRQAFTLVEIVSVTCIILVLVALLFPSLKKARETGHSARCMANLRTAGTAAIQLFNDQNGEFLQSPFWYWYSSSSLPKGMIDYFGIKDPNVKVDTVLTCPAIKAMLPRMFPIESNRCFSVNTYLHAKEPSSFYNGGWERGDDYENTYMRMSNVEKPGRLLLFTDGGLPPVSDVTWFFTMIIDSNYILFPHNGKQNVVFLDGHVEALTKQQFDNPPSHREFWGDLR